MRTVALGFVLCCFLIGCGQSGKLYLPKKNDTNVTTQEATYATH